MHLYLNYILIKGGVEAKIIQDQLNEQTLLLYIKRLTKPIKPRNPKTIEKEKSIASSKN